MSSAEQQGIKAILNLNGVPYPEGLSEAELRSTIGDRAINALRDRVVVGKASPVADSGNSQAWAEDELTKMKLDVFQNANDLQQLLLISRVLSPQYPAESDGTLRGDLLLAYNALFSAKDHLIKLEEQDLLKTQVQANQSAMMAIDRVNRNPVSRFTAGEETKRGADLIVQFQAVQALGNSINPDFNPNNENHLAKLPLAIRTFYELKALSDEYVTKKRCQSHEERLNQLKAEERWKKEKNDYKVEFVAKSFRGIFEYAQSFVFDDNSGLVVSVVRVAKKVGIETVDLAGSVVKKVINIFGDSLREVGNVSDKIKDPGIFIPVASGAGAVYGIVFVAGISNPILVGAGAVVALGATRFVVDRISNAKSRVEKNSNGPTIKVEKIKSTMLNQPDSSLISDEINSALGSAENSNGSNQLIEKFSKKGNGIIFFQ